MRNRYTIQSIEEKINEHPPPSEDYDIAYDVHIPTCGDVEDAYAALKSNYWDSLDIRADEVICYPADSNIDYRTGERSRTQIIIKGKENAIEHLMDYYFRKEDGKRGISHSTKGS